MGDLHAREVEDVTGVRLLVTMLLNFAITAAEILGGLISGSLALLSDALHNFSDGLSIVISYTAIKLRGRPNSARHTFGFKRAEVFAAVINSATLLVITVFLFIEAGARFIHPQPIHGQWMFIVAAIGLVANVIGTTLLHHGAKSSVNIKASYLHLLTDAISSVGVILGGVTIYLWHVYWLDPVLTILIGIYILKEAYAIIKETAHILMEGTPPGVSVEEIKKAIDSIPGVRDFHHVHVWSVGEHDCCLEGHLAVDDVPMHEADRIRTQAAKVIKERFGIGHITLQVEHSPCPDPHLISQPNPH